MGPGFESLRTHHKNDSESCYFFAVEGVPFPTHHENNSISCYFFMLLGTFATVLQPRFAWRTPAHQADVRFLQILCFALYYRSLWASYDSLRTHHKNDSACCYCFAVEGVPFPTHHENNSLSCYFFMLLVTFVTVLQPRFAWRTPAHQDDVRFCI